MTAEDRVSGRQRLRQPLWDDLRIWLQLQRQRVAGGAIGQALDYTLNNPGALTLHQSDGHVPIDKNHLEQQIKPWKLGAKNWLFICSELAGERAAVVMSLVQSPSSTSSTPRRTCATCWRASTATQTRASTSCCRTAGDRVEGLNRAADGTCQPWAGRGPSGGRRGGHVPRWPLKFPRPRRLDCGHQEVLVAAA